MNILLPCRLIGIASVLLMAFTLAGCGRNVTRAQQLEVQADAQIAGGDGVRAAETLEEAIEKDSNDPGRWVKLGRVRRDLGQPAQAVAAFQQAFDLDPTNIEAMQNLAVLYVAGRRYDEAKAIVDPLLSLSPDDIAGVLTTGAVAYYEERYGEALKIADRLIQLVPDSKEGYVLRAHVLEKTGHIAEAARVLEERLKLTPDDPEMAEQLLLLYRSISNVEGVRSTAIKLVKLRPNDPRYRLEAVRAFHARGRIAEREEASAYILGRYRDNPSVLGALADFWIAALPRDEATRRTERAAAIAAPEAKAALAGRLIRSGALTAAARLLDPVAGQKVIQANADLHAMFAALLVAQGKMAAARDRASQVLAFDSGNDVALLARARAEQSLKRYDQALTDAQSALAQNPGNEGAALLIADVYAAQGNDSLANSAYADAQSAAPRSINVARARTGWLVRRGREAEAAQVAGLFARQVKRDDAWALYADMCRAAKDPICLLQAQAGAS